MRLKEIKNKINLNQNIFNLTRSLELISVVQLKRLKNLAISSRLFSEKLVEVLIRLLQYQKFFKPKFPVFRSQEIKKILVLVFGSERGFCGAYNRNILKYAQGEIEELEKIAEVELGVIGKKASNFFKKKNYKITIEFPEIKEFEEIGKSNRLAKLLLELYQKGEYQLIILFYTHYLTPFFQLPRKIQILPPEEEKFEEMLKETAGQFVSQKRFDYIFEPSFEEIFWKLVYQLAEVEVYHAILEARASEEASRMLAMKRAMDNAKEIIKNLTLEFHKESQAQITAEICEITSAKEALQ